MYEEMMQEHEQYGKAICSYQSRLACEGNRPMRIAICGKFKSGKTSLLNLLLGLDLPVRAITATKLITRI